MDAGRMRVNRYKLKQGRVRADVRKNFFSARTVRQQQRLPREDGAVLHCWRF